MTSTALKLRNHTHTYTQKKLLAAFRPKILYENNKKKITHTRTHYKEKLIISLLDLEQNKKSIIYKAHSEEKKQLNGHVIPQEKEEIKFINSPTHTLTQTCPHQHLHKHTETEKKTL